MRILRFVHLFSVITALMALHQEPIEAQADHQGERHVGSPTLRIVPPAGTWMSRHQATESRSGRRDAVPVPPNVPLAAQAATGRPAEHRWELEVHGGWLLNGRPSSGVSSLPSTGALVSSQISVTSFLFGDGARIFNQNQAAIPDHLLITPLDSVLRGSALQPPRGAGTAGARISRALRGRFTAELAFDYDRAALALTEAALTGIEATRASSERALEQMLSAAAVPSSARVTASVHDEAKLSRLAATGALLIDFRPGRTITPYVTLGGGVVFRRVAEGPSATLTGTYELGTSAEIVGIDTVRLHYSIDDLEYAGVVGGGIKYALAPRWGLRVDGRARISPNSIVSLVDATPGLTLRSTGSPFPLVSSGNLQFSSTDPLTGGPITSARTFTGTGLRTQIDLVAGLFWRF